MHDVETEQQVGERSLLGRLDRVAQVADRGLAVAGQLEDAVVVERVDVGDVAQEAELEEQLHLLLPQALDVHGAPRTEVGDAGEALLRAVGVDAAGLRLALLPHEPRTARRALLGELPFGEALGTQLQDRADDLGDDVAGLAHDHRVAGADVLDLDLVLVVQRGQADGGTADEDGLEHRERRGLARAADGYLDVLERGRALLGRQLVGDRPPRRLGRGAERRLHRQVVDLHHHAVDLVRQVVAVLHPVGAEVVDVVQRVEHLGLGVHRQAELPEPLQRARVRGRRVRPHDLAELVAPERQPPGRRDRRVLLAQRSRSGVAGVHGHRTALAPRGLGRLVLRDRLRLQPVERRDGQVHLATGFEHLRRAIGQPVGDVGDGGHVGRDVLAGAAVAAGGGLHEPAVLVAQGHGQAVDLELAHVAHRAVEPQRCQLARRAVAPASQLVEVHRVVERHHPHRVGDRRELGRRGTAHLLGGAVGGDQVGVERLELLQLPDEQVVVGVGDRRRVELVVAAVVRTDLLTELVDATGRVHLGDRVVGRGLLRRGGVLRCGHGGTLPVGADSPGRAPLAAAEGRARGDDVRRRGRGGPPRPGARPARPRRR